jgi:serine/threonine protein kinase
MATVYKAYDTRLERDVAVKVIRPEKLALATLEKSLKRFEREAIVLARLSHPNIVKVLDFGEQDGFRYLVMEYLRGGTLKSILGRPIPFWEGARLLLPITQALEFAHRHGIVHRDVKPSNLLFSETGDLMLSDFGIAKMLDLGDASRLTSTNMTLGTPDYMAPEQIHSKDVDHRADIYSLGVVLYEMITGRKPFIGKNPMAVLLKSASEPPPAPSLFVAGLPGYVEGALLRALAKKPEERFADMASFAAIMRKMADRQGLESPLQSPQTTAEDSEKTIDVFDLQGKFEQQAGADGMASPKFSVQDRIIVCPFCHQPTDSGRWTCSHCGRNFESVVLVMKRRS